MNLQEIKQEETFEHYMQSEHARSYTGTDDDMPESYERWVTEMETDLMLAYAQRFGEVLIDKVVDAAGEHVVDYVEAECEFVKEDVSDGNYGYFKIYPRDLEAFRDFKQGV